MNTKYNGAGTRQWSNKSVNFQTGCENNCLVCYAKEMSIRYKQTDKYSWSNPAIRNKSVKQKIKKWDESLVMFPSAHDITPQHLSEAIQFLKNILLPGNQVLIVSKPHLECVKAICDEFVDYKDKILFRFTIGSAKEATLKFWEPGAPSFEERVASVKYAFEKGYETSISCEPMLDNRIGDVITAVRAFVTHSIWLGKMIKTKQRLEMNTPITDELKEKANQLHAWQSDDEIKALYQRYKNDPLIRWKGEIKTILRIPLGAIGSDE